MRVMILGNSYQPMLDVRRTTERLVFALVVLGLFGPPSVAGSMPPDTTRTAPSLSAFDPEAGQLLKQYFSPDAYGADRANWDATQDDRGLLYVANPDGVLVYDGRAWHREPIPNRASPRNLARSETGRVFVGAEGDIGVMRPDTLGRMRYVSLVNRVPEAHRSLGEVHRVASAGKGVYFMSRQRLFYSQPEADSMRVWTAGKGAFTGLNVVQETPYVAVAGTGLSTVEDDTLRVVAGGEAFAGRDVSFTLGHPERGLIVGTPTGLFVRDDGAFRPFSTEAQEQLKRAYVRTATLLPDGTIAVATVRAGLFLLAPDGTLRRRLSARDNPVLGLHQDREGGLWALQYGGMIRYDVGAPVTEHGAATGIQGTPTRTMYHEGTLYVTTTRSSYRLRPANGSPASFEELPSVGQETNEVQCWNVLFDDDQTLVGTTQGLARIGPNDTVDHLTSYPVYDFLRDKADSSRIYAATNRGLRVLRRTADGWEINPLAPGFESELRVLLHGDDNSLWATTGQGVYRLTGIRAEDAVTVEQFGDEHGLPDGTVWLYRWQGTPVFGTPEGPMRFESSPTPRFIPIDSIEMPPGTAEEQVYLSPGTPNRTWGFLSDRGPGRWRLEGDTWRWRPGSLHRFRTENVFQVQVDENEEAVWFGTRDGRLLRYVPDGGVPRSPPAARIREVSTLDPDSIVTADGSAAAPATLPFARNSLRVTYGAPTLVQIGAVEYQHRLTGSASPDWSDWTGRTEQVYRNLSHGEHTVAVRARTAYGDTTATARYSFTVLPPWYRTWWAYALYLLAAVGVVAGAVRARTWQLRQRREELEATVEERTREIEAQKERLEELDEAKSRFFANVSHEFRTPLTLIQGPAREVRKNLQRGTVEPEQDAEQLTLIERNTGRLLRLVDQLLGIARLDAGSYELNARPTDLSTELQRVARTFEPMAEREGLTLTVETDDAPPDADPVYVDREALEHVLSNLLSNAVKFTPSGGAITITVRETPAAAEITVADTGPGIPDAEEDAIFDRFEQVDDTSTRAQEGAGIGLAFAADLVDLHGGRIELDSTEGEGTAITVHLRRGTAPLSEEQIAEAVTVDEASGPSTAPEATAGDGPSAPDEDPAAPAVLHASGPAPEASDGAPDASTGKRVLVVDDNEEVRRYVRSILEPDFVVMEASNGKEGLKKAREALPDVILADVMMPSVDGHEMTRRLKDDPETEAIPVIMVTARVGTDEEVEGLQVGADDYVTKPFDADVLQQRVEGVVALQERLRDRLREKIGEEEASPDDAPERSEMEREARQVIREHITDQNLAATALAEQMGMSRTSLYRAFDEQTDTTPSALITEVRMERATELLREGEGTVTQVAYAVGYDTLSGFSRAFRKHVGQPPSAVAGEH